MAGLPCGWRRGLFGAIEHPCWDLQPSIRFRSIQRAAENNAMRLVDRRVHDDLSARPRMMRIENLAKNGLVGVLKPRCTMPSGHTPRSDIVRPPQKRSCRQRLTWP